VALRSDTTSRFAFYVRVSTEEARDPSPLDPPKRNRKDEMPLRQTWRRSQIQAMRNPKYTG
jgi:hypothetical protein